MLDPYAACYSKRASFSNTVIDGVDLAKADLNRLSALFNDEFVQEFKANPVSVYGHLPDPVKKMIRECCAKDTGPKPTSQAANNTGEPTDLLAPRYSNSAGMSW
jgi:hypothetical protein